MELVRSITSSDLLELMVDGGQETAFLDVRSEGEYAKGALPMFQNFPILDNVERHEVGLVYKQRGQESAIEQGLALTLSHRMKRVELWCKYIKSSEAKKAIVSCWRGGLRSRFAAEWLRESVDCPVFTVQGGYKAIRSDLLFLLKSEDPAFVVVGGCTGSRKTELLSVASNAYIDLEEMACHRGSAFGALYDLTQPSQATFENRLLFTLNRFQKRGVHRILIEDESLAIGTLALPMEIKTRITQAPVIIIDASVEERALHIAQEYAVEPISFGIEIARVQSALRAAVLRLSKRLGGGLTDRILKQMQDAFESDPLGVDRHKEWVRDLLVEHYDKYYMSSMQRLNRKVLFHGNFKECEQWVKSQFV
jgi:tRNA 2-selenouridine synthase